jgi:hypothetical protein
MTELSSHGGGRARVRSHGVAAQSSQRAQPWRWSCTRTQPWHGGGRAHDAPSHGGDRAAMCMAQRRGELARGELAIGRRRHRAHGLQSRADVRLTATMCTVSWSRVYLCFRSISYYHAAAIRAGPHTSALRTVYTKFFLVASTCTKVDGWLFN